jgi:glycosyltransferase involved in cell wall biosynthesis
MHAQANFSQLTANTNYIDKSFTVTVAIPTFNEEASIERVVRTFLSTNYSNLVEVIVCDGGSHDRTIEIVNKLSSEDTRVRLLHNHHRIQSVGLNLILQECIGDIFLRADAHSEYAPDYLEKCVEALIESKALNVGGAQRFVAKTPFQAGISLASKSILGSGGAKYRDPNFDGFADTVYIGCFWKKALLDVGGFDTMQVTNQDAELNQKLLDLSENAIYISSKIRVWYYPRKTWKGLVTQYIKYGRGRYLTTIKHSKRLQIRGKLPFIVFSLTLSLIFIDLLFSQIKLPVLEFFCFVILLTMGESLRVNIKYRTIFQKDIWRGDIDKIPPLLIRFFYCGVILLTMPIAHFSGYGYQLFRNKVLHISGW